ncbi:MAG: NAD-dependent epimerase/dehydratase family protein [Pirellulales bacterium]|nr:NAD-dependent epimerase/dehydratase family protein [Pirellulales bacterium]
MATTRKPAEDSEASYRGHPLTLNGRAGEALSRGRSIGDSFPHVAQLEHALSEPSDELIRVLSRIEGDMIVLGVGGKMGPSLARMIRRAFDAAGSSRRVIGVSRFSNASLAAALRSDGVETIEGDLLSGSFVRSLPRVENVFYLVGMKFGTVSDAAQTWASNTYLAGLVADHFRESRIAALSTGNVYGMVPIDAGRGSVETDPPAPTGEYAMSVLGRERVFEHFSRALRTPISIVRLNYATEFRYGVLVDLAKKVRRGEPISLTMGYFNAIWQRDACEMIVRSLEYANSPPLILNVTGVERLSCRRVCERFGELLDKDVRFMGVESETALLSDPGLAVSLFGPPLTPVDEIIAGTAQWISRGGETWNKPTQFEVRDGKY